MIWKIRPDKLTAFEISSAEEKKAKKRPDPKATVATKLLPPTASKRNGATFAFLAAIFED